jgi:hypothetical protein
MLFWCTGAFAFTGAFQDCHLSSFSLETPVFEIFLQFCKAVKTGDFNSIFI